MEPVFFFNNFFFFSFLRNLLLTYYMMIHKTIHIYNLDQSNEVVPVLMIIDLELEMVQNHGGWDAQN